MKNEIDILKSCNICPHNCGVDRTVSPNGVCGMGTNLVIYSFGPHFGEEPELTGRFGSGTIFFTGCNLLCVFCQNYDISHLREGYGVDERRLSEIMLLLQERGCSNINFVTPTHFTLQIIQAVKSAKTKGLNIPVVWNTGGYEKTETIKMLEGIVDIYMPDLKFVREDKSNLYTEAEDYFSYASRAVTEMHRQVGDLIIRNGVSKRGLLIRHLILPENQSDTEEIINFIAEELGTNTYLNLMEQYHPCYKADEYPLINNRISFEEYNYFVDYARKKGFRRPDYIFK
ncbi:MAG: radical SAM protein [Ignavibacteria bacterium]|nr:radical SAM protein [Ignavibacteria bacterium]